MSYKVHVAAKYLNIGREMLWEGNMGREGVAL